MMVLTCSKILVLRTMFINMIYSWIVRFEKKKFANFKLQHMDLKSEADRSEYPEFGFVNVHLREVSLSHPIHCLLKLLNCVYYVWITVGHETEHTSSLLWCSSTIGPAFLPIKSARNNYIWRHKPTRNSFIGMSRKFCIFRKNNYLQYNFHWPDFLVNEFVRQ